METITRDTRNPNSAEVLHEQAEGECGVSALNARTLLRLPTPELRSIARQERTYRLNTEPGWRPSDLLASIVDDLLAGKLPTSPTARAMLAEVIDGDGR